MPVVEVRKHGVWLLAKTVSGVYLVISLHHHVWFYYIVMLINWESISIVYFQLIGRPIYTPNDS